VQTAPLVVEAPDAASCVLGLRLRPVGAYALLGCPLPALTDATVDLAALLGRDAAELAERCHALADVPARLALVAAWVAARLARRATARGGTPHPAVAWAAARLEGAHGVASVTRLREATGLGRTRFAEAFRAHGGRRAQALRARAALPSRARAAARRRARPRAAGARPRRGLLRPRAPRRRLPRVRRHDAHRVPRALRYHDAPSLAEPA
jgi:hypothetical protein